MARAVRRREELRRETLQTESELKATFAGSTLNPFLLPNENYAKSAAQATWTSDPVELSPYGRNLPLFPDITHVGISDRVELPLSQLPQAFLEAEEDNAVPHAVPAFFARLAPSSAIEVGRSGAFKTAVLKPTAPVPIAIASDDESPMRPALPHRSESDLSKVMQSTVIQDKLQNILRGQTEMLKRSGQSRRLWGNIELFSVESLMELYHLAEIPDPNSFEQLDAPYELPDLVGIMKELLKVSTDTAQLWTFKYRPTVFNHVCGHKNWAAFLHTWLGKWRDAMIDSGASAAPLFKSSRGDTSEDDFDFHGHDDDSVSGHSMNSAMLIAGPTGAGKTAAIYACASQLNYSVIEVNPSSDRSGQQIKNLFAEATQSHRASAGSTRNPTVSATREPSADAGVSLILFEEVDNLFPEDKGFFQALGNLLEDSKRPILMTCDSNRVPREIRGRAGVAHWPILPISSSAIFVLVNLILLVEDPTGHTQLSPVDAERLSALYNADLRRIILAVQFAFQTSRGEPISSFSNFAVGLPCGVTLSGSSLSTLVDLISFGDITPASSQFQRRIEIGNLCKPAVPLPGYLSWPTLFSPACIATHDELFRIDNDAFQVPLVDSMVPVHAPALFRAEEPRQNMDAKEDEFINSNLNGNGSVVSQSLASAVAPLPIFQLPPHAISPKIALGAKLFDETVVPIAESYSLLDVLTYESEYLSLAESVPLPEQRRCEMAASIVAMCMSNGLLAASEVRTHTGSPVSWAARLQDDILLANKEATFGALWKFVPPLVTSRSLNRDYLPLLARMCFLEESRKQLNTKRRFQERLSLRSAAVSPMEINLLADLNQLVGFTPEAAPIDG